MKHVAVPMGFRFAALHCGIKQDSTWEDLVLVLADRPSTAAGVYTTNQVVAAPVLLDRQRTPRSDARAVIVNSGNANACTGNQGMENALAMAGQTAEAIGVAPEQVLVMSTGIIGEQLPMERIAPGIPRLVQAAGSSSDHVLAAARGIMTTDTRPKVQSRQFTVSDRQVTVLGMAKGAGMIGPRMATLLGMICTDMVLAPETAQTILNEVADATFNCTRVEGHTSTNDTVLLLASGASGVEFSGQAAELFRVEVERVCGDLAKAVADDGEGATHLIEIRVTGAADVAQARQVARTIADSPLVKTAIAGADPNWGRIVSAAGYSGVPIDPARLTLRLNGFLLFEAGQPVAFSHATVSTSIAQQRQTLIELGLGTGNASGHCWTCDLTADYVRINADYHT